MKILVFGVSGKIGHKIFLTLAKDREYDIVGVTRSVNSLPKSILDLDYNIIEVNDVRNLDLVNEVINTHKPNIIINAVGVVKQSSLASNLQESFEINSLWPHQLVGIAKKVNAHVVQISSDCVYSGSIGHYNESDVPDPLDFYGQTKWMGELPHDNATTIRTSTIGHEIGTQNGLIEWFLAQSGSINGYQNAVFSGIPTIELANIIRDKIIPNIKNLHGIYHLASRPINKYDLLIKVASRYNKNINITACNQPVINRSLNGSKFNNQVEYLCPDWDQLIDIMHLDYIESTHYSHVII